MMISVKLSRLSLAIPPREYKPRAVCIYTPPKKIFVTLFCVPGDKADINVYNAHRCESGTLLAAPASVSFFLILQRRVNRACRHGYDDLVTLATNVEFLS
jgi:hypothetical protein